MIKVCPHCNQQYSVSPNSGDYVHDCSVATSESLKNDDVKEVGNNKKPQEVLRQGIANKLWGTLSGNQGEVVINTTSRGNKKDLTYTRKHEEYIE